MSAVPGMMPSGSSSKFARVIVAPTLNPSKLKMESLPELS
jgi:hypothetical protein